MARGSRAREEMIEVISTVDEEWPVTLLYLAPNGADMKVLAGRSENRIEEQLTLVAMYLLFLEDQLDGDLNEVSERAVTIAEEMRANDDIGEIHRGGSLEDSE